MSRTGWLGGVAMFALAACGDATVVCPAGSVLVDGTFCADVVCGEGTVEHDGQCVGYDPNDKTAPSTTATPTGSITLVPPNVVVLTADEPATIFYTVDGSDPTSSSSSAPSPLSVFDVPENAELKFFARDLAGNEEEVKSEIYAVDDSGPGPVTGLTAAIDGGSIDLMWTNPVDEDFAGVVVVRSVVEPTFEPIRSEVYETGSVGTAEEILFVGFEEQLTDSAPFPGFDRYTVWTYDELGNYGAPVSTTTPTPLPVPTQTGTIAVDVTTGAVTVTTQPSSFTISGTSTVDSGEIDLAITLESAVGRPFFNTKLLVDSLNEGTTAGDGMLGLEPYVHYGVRAMATGEARTESLLITGITGGVNPIVMTVRIRDDPVIVHASSQQIGAFGLTDSSGVAATTAVTCAAVAWEGSGSSRCSLRDAVFSRDGRFIYASNGWGSSLAAIDSSTLAVVAGADLHPTGGPGSVASVQRSPDGKFIYALVVLNGHYRGGGSLQGQGGSRVVDVVKLDAGTLEEVGRVNLFSPGQTGVAMRNLSLSADGRYAAAVSQSLHTLFFVDLENMVVTQTTVTSAYASSPSALAIEPDGSGVWVMARFNNASIVRVDRETLVPTTVSLGTSSGRPGQLAFGADGLLYVGRKDPATNAGLVTVDVTSELVDDTYYPTMSVKGIGFNTTGSLAYFVTLDSGSGNALIATFDAVTHSPITTFPAYGSSNDRAGHWLGVSPF